MAHKDAHASKYLNARNITDLRNLAPEERDTFQQAVEYFYAILIRNNCVGTITVRQPDDFPRTVIGEYTIEKMKKQSQTNEEE